MEGKRIRLQIQRDQVQLETPPNRSVVGFSTPGILIPFCTAALCFECLIGQGFDDGVDTVWLSSSPDGEREIHSVLCFFALVAALLLCLMVKPSRRTIVARVRFRCALIQTRVGLGLCVVFLEPRALQLIWFSLLVVPGCSLASLLALRHAPDDKAALQRGGQEPQAVYHGPLAWGRPRNDRSCPTGLR